MLRLILLLFFITLFSLGAAWIADEPGKVLIDWGIYHIETSLLIILAAIATLSLSCMIVYAVLYGLIRTPRSWMRSRLAKRQAQGLTALTQAFVAIASQDITTAKKQIGKAKLLLPHQPLTLMLSAQIARLEGNESQARLYLDQMLKTEGTEFIAMRGLIENARRNHDDLKAIEYAEKAIALKADDSWLITTLAGLYIKQGRAQNALQLLDSSARKRYLTKAEWQKLSSNVLYENAHQLTEQQRSDFAIAVLEDCLRRNPSFTPAAALLGRIYLQQGEIKRAIKIIQNAWKHQPHPLLTEILLDFYDNDADRKKIIYAAEKLAQLVPEHRESRFLMAAINIKRQDYDTARSHLMFLLDNKETARACTLMAEVENAWDNHEEAAQWLKRAALATQEPCYICDICKTPDKVWHLVCKNCVNIATLKWDDIK